MQVDNVFVEAGVRSVEFPKNSLNNFKSQTVRTVTSPTHAYSSTCCMSVLGFHDQSASSQAKHEAHVVCRAKIPEFIELSLNFEFTLGRGGLGVRGCDSSISDVLGVPCVVERCTKIRHIVPFLHKGTLSSAVQLRFACLKKRHKTSTLQLLLRHCTFAF